MAESKSIKDPENRGSDEVPNLFCEICLKEGVKSGATAYCINCDEHFCKLCLKYHMTFLKDHGILDGDRMPQDVERCPAHREIIKFYCQSCDKFACNTCKENHDKSVSNKPCTFKTVSELSKNIAKSLELKILITKMDKSVSKSVNLKHNLSNLETVATRAKQEVQDIKDKFLAKALQMDSEIDKREKEDSEKVLMLKAKTDTFVSKPEAVSNKFKQRHKTIQTQRSDMFIVMKHLQSEIVSLDKEMDDISTEMDNLKYTFEPNESTKLVIEEKQSLGKLKPNSEINRGNEVTMEKRKTAVFQYDIIDDAFDEAVKEFCVLPGQIVAVCDSTNFFVKLLNTRQKFVITTLQLNTTPTAITYVEDRQFAVARHSLKNGTASRITFIVWSKKNTLQFTGKHFNVDLECRDIIHDKNQLIVLLVHPNYHDCKVQIINMYGQVLKTFNNDQNFSTFSWLALDNKRNKLYGTNLQMDSLTQIQLDRNVKEDERQNTFFLLAPAGITFDKHGCMYASLHGHNKIIYENLIPSDSEDLLTHDDGIFAPQTLKFCDQDNLLYVDTDKCIKVFKIEEKECVWKETLQMVGKWEPI